MTRILVTGGAGYIGSHACKALAAAGHTPIAYDNLVHGHAWAVKWGPLEVGDIGDARRLAQAFAVHRPEAVMHFAAYAYVGESVADPARYYRNNVGGALTLLEVMRASEVDAIVFSSTCATYGIPRVLPIAEDAPQAPISPYGASKLMVERMLADYAAAYGLKSVALRYFNAAGADPDGEIGESHDPETHLIPLVLDAAATGAPVTVLGDDYDTADGTCVRDYVHVGDIAEAHVLALEGLRTGQLRRAYNLGAGVGFSVAEIIEAARRITGRPVRAVVGPRRPGDPAAMLADPRLAAAELGWKARHDLEAIIRTAWEWRMRGVESPVASRTAPRPGEPGHVAAATPVVASFS
ncbi:MAG: UDP-glucose 4-epimerase GalE [Caulobacteraceae bacterium]|nr:UDP-glucose 4-epimerase GalE [Caulobacteraceae bacterium]